MTAAELKQLWPSLAPVRPRTPTPAMHPLVAWAGLVREHGRSGFKLRNPAQTSAGLIGPFHGVGYCLEPVLSSGCSMWFDPSEPAHDGDIVMAQFHPSVIDRIFDERAGDPKFMETYGSQPRAQLGTVVKWLKFLAGVPYLITNDSATPLDGGQFGKGRSLGPSKVLGVLRFLGPAANLLMQAPHMLPGVKAPSDTADLNNEAATTFYSSTDSTQTTTAIAQTFMTISVAAQTADHTATVTVVADVWKTVAGQNAACFIARLSGGIPVGTASQLFNIPTAASPGTRAALQFEFAASANTAYDYSFWYSAVDLGNLGEARNISMQVTLIKR